MRRANTWRIGLIVVILGFSASAPAVQEPARSTVARQMAFPTASADGKELFGTYCAVCHGKLAKGDGPAARVLKVPPPDLTMLTKNNGGSYNWAAVERSIGGTGGSVGAHGSSDMPVWGPIFRSMGHDQQQTATRVKNLIRYLESLQAK